MTRVVRHSLSGRVKSAVIRHRPSFDFWKPRSRRGSRVGWWEVIGSLHFRMKRDAMRAAMNAALPVGVVAFQFGDPLAGIAEMPPVTDKVLELLRKGGEVFPSFV